MEPEEGVEAAGVDMVESEECWEAEGSQEEAESSRQAAQAEEVEELKAGDGLAVLWDMELGEDLVLDHVSPSRYCYGSRCWNFPSSSRICTSRRLPLRRRCSCLRRGTCSLCRSLPLSSRP